MTQLRILRMDVDIESIMQNYREYRVEQINNFENMRYT